jgi:hypothetical protein
MKKVLCSFGFGEHAQLLSLAAPTFYIYSHNHNYDLFIPSLSYFSEETKKRHPSWWKIELIGQLFDKYDQVLWIDSDIIICRFDKDIMDDLPPEKDTGLVVHQTDDGYVPNCGVWPLNKSCLSWFHKLWPLNDFKRSSCWWEQAAMLSLLGVDPDKSVIDMSPNADNILWQQLDYVWNPHINDARKIPDDTRFFHATSFKNRYSAMKNILQQINI